MWVKPHVWLSPFYLLGGADCYYHKWNLWFLDRLGDICFFYFLQNLASSPLLATVVSARRNSVLGFQTSLPNNSMYRKTPEVPKLSVSGQHGKLGQSPVESKCSFHMRWKQQGPSYSHALRATGLNMMRLFCQHLKLSIGLFSKLMMSHNLSLKRPLWKITKASSFLRNYCGWWSSSLWTFTTGIYSSPPTINPTPTSLLKLRADYITLFTSNYLLSLLQLPKGFSLHQQVLWITEVNKWIGTTRLE